MPWGNRQIIASKARLQLLFVTFVIKAQLTIYVQPFSQSTGQIYEKMMEKDCFTAWLGLQLDHIEEGCCQMHFTLKPEMSNGFGSVHGGILFSAADSVFAFACNSHGLVAVALEASIHFLRPAFPGDTLSIKADLIVLGKRTGVYEVKTFNEQNELISLFKATAHRSQKPALPE